jgi:hypothetical protein
MSRGDVRTNLASREADSADHYVTIEWARDFPAEQIWKDRKA